MRQAFGHFSILPAGGSTPPDRTALAYLPFVGAVTAALAGALGWLVALRAPAYAGIAAWIAALVLTGAIHFDGFLDACDGLFATTTPARRLEIMRDPRHGTFAIAGAIAISLLWIRALDTIAPAALPLTMAFAATVARLAAIANAWRIAYASSGTLVRAFDKSPPLLPLIVATMFACALGWWLGPRTLVLIPAAVVLSVLVGWWASRRLANAITGDVYGAIVVVTEVAILMALPATLG